MPLSFLISSLIQNVQSWVAFFLVGYWWFWLFLILFFLARALWLAYVQEFFKKTAIKPLLLELKIPREVRRSPRAMEQIFMSIHSVRNAPTTPQDKWWDGEVTMWFSFEVTSHGGEPHFYVRIPSRHRNMIEAAFYAQYPDIELVEVKEDYINSLPFDYIKLKKQGYELFGNELILKKPDAYPIRTYLDFEEKVEEQQLDPISALLETMVKAKPQEHIWLQIITRPTIDDSWKKEGEKVVRELKEKSGRRQIQTPLGEFVMIDRSPGEIEVMKAVDKNLEKSGFYTVIRYLYIAPKEIYDTNFGQRSIISVLNQYASEALNQFGHNIGAWTRTNPWFWPFIFPKRRQQARRERIYANYRVRKMYDETFMGAVLNMKFFHWGIKGQKAVKNAGLFTLREFVLNTEELATIFHLPTYAVLTGPLIKRSEARKAGPPAGLPIYGEEDNRPTAP